MKIYMAAYEPERVGGGWSFQRNFAKALGRDITFYENADVFFITSASMVQRDEVIRAKMFGMKIVLRVDNIIRNSRNRNTGMSRMKDIADMADLVVYQSQFARKLLNPYLNAKNWSVILNSVDQDIFNTENHDISKDLRYLYAKYSSDETKNWEMARSYFQWALGPKHLNIVGRFDSKLEEYGFDFYQGEQFTYHGLVEDPRRMAEIYKQSDVLLYSYFNDACSNTLIEAISSGLVVADCYGMLKTGGAPEIMDHCDGPEYFGLPRMAREYREALSEL